MMRPTEQWAYEIATRIVDTVNDAKHPGHPSAFQKEAIEVWAKDILESCPFQPKWKEDKFLHEWNLIYPYPYLPHVRESELHPNTYIALCTRYDTIDAAQIAAEEELMRRLKKPQ